MTRAQYQQKYGKAPSVPAQVFDNNPAVPQLTRAQYEERYGAAPQQVATPPKEPGILGKAAGFVKDHVTSAVKNLGTLYGGSEQGIASKLSQDVQAGATDIEAGKPIKGAIKSGFRTAGDVAGAIYAPIGEAVGATGLNEGLNYLGELSQKGGKYNPINLVTDTKAVQDFVLNHPNLEEDFVRAMNIALAAADSGKIDPKTVVPRTIEQVTSFSPSVPDVPGIISKAKTSIETSRKNSAVEGVKQAIYNVETNYAKMRKANQYLKDEGDASRGRVAQSGVLQDAVDTEGTIRTKQKGGAVEKYKEKTIDGYEGVVRKNLVREGETVNIAEIERRLESAIDKSGMEGADLVTALNGVAKEIKGLELRADTFGDIPLVKIHDAKIDTTSNINYQTPPETAKYRKTVARTYKELVEEKSGTNVKEVNAELQKYYQDLDLLERLDGAKVKGGKLGKYFAQLSGNIAGGAAGFMLGGPVGGAIGPIIGGEAASLLKGAKMSRTFNGKTGNEVPGSPILQKAKETAAKPPARDLTKPDTKVGAPKDIEKTKAIIKIERDIEKNVDAQKVAIKEKNYPLVDHLKDIYEFLVENLKNAIKTAKEALKDQRGFVRIPHNRGSRKTQTDTTSTAINKAIPDDSSTGEVFSQV